MLIYGACDRPGPEKDDIATIVQVQTSLPELSAAVIRLLLVHVGVLKSLQLCEANVILKGTTGSLSD